jgi:class 3 adenylate cyclase/tetratricopeptide (TPR) repeat protein
VAVPDPEITPAARVGSPRPYMPRLLLQHLDAAPEGRWWTVDGSVVFVDISGFTKLSERLAKHGKEGAEQVTEAIEGCFTALLAVAYANGGGLIKFGGDALLLLFEGDDHVLRAARSAVLMRRVLRDAGRIELPGVKLQLRMSVGMHTGRYHFFLIGRSHRELVVAGPAWTRTVEMEHDAEAGKILVSPEVAAALPARCIGRSKGPGHLLVREPPGHVKGLDAIASDLDVAGAEVGLSVAVREHVLGGGGAPEHRTVTVAFVHFDGTDRMIAVDGPEAVASRLEALVEQIQGAVDEQGICFLGSDVDADGGKIILTAGAPRVSGNDEERMLLALRRVVDPPGDIPVRVGVNRGSVFAGDIGPWYRRTYTVMGDAVNLAARLMAKAGPGEVYVTADVLDRSNTSFETIALEPFLVKGKAKPIQAWAVGDAVGSKARQELDGVSVATERLPLVGRAVELEVLGEALDSARRGEGRLVELVGEPGIGKTRLMEELRERASGLTVLHATAEAYTATTPYSVWRELLRDVLGLRWEDPDDVVLTRLFEVVEELDPELEPWLSLLAIPLDVDVAESIEVEMLSPEFRRAKLDEVVGRLLDLVLSSPTLIEIEDVHLMDPASTELLGSLVDGLHERAWMVLVTRRDEPTGFAGGEAIHVVSQYVSPLGPDDTLELARAATDATPLLPHDLRDIADRAAGNPQFLLDLVRAKAAGSMLPDSIETAAMARIDQLDPTDREIVRRASVLGIAFHPRFLDDVLDEGARRPDAATWERLSEFFEEDGEGYLRFRRAIVRDTAYGGLPFRLRRRLHAAAGERLERELGDAADEASGILSLHFFLAGDFARAWRYARHAGDRAAGQFANLEAAKLYRRAIDAGRKLPELAPMEIAAVFEAQGDVLDLAGEFRDASTAYSNARRLAQGDPVVEARLLLKRSQIEEKLGRYPQALRWATRGRKALDQVAGPAAAKQRAQLGAWYATVLQAEGRTRDAFAWATRVSEEAAAADDREALARAYHVIDWANLTSGRPTGEYWRRALGLYEILGDLVMQARILGNLGAAAFYDGRWDEAITYYKRTREVALRNGDLVYATVAADNLAEVFCERGLFEESQELLRDSLRFWRASEYRYFMGGCLEYLGRVMSRIGCFQEALDAFEEARNSYVHVGARDDVLLIDARVAECQAHMGNASVALELATEALSSAAAEGEGMIVPLLHRVRGFALTQMGDRAAARQAFEESLRAAEARRDDYEVALTLQAFLRLARFEASPAPEEILTRATEIFERLGVIALAVVPMSAASAAGQVTG